MVRQSFQTLCHINEFMHPRISLIDAAKFRIYLKCPVDRHIQFHRHHLCQPIHLCIREIQRFSYCLDNSSRCHSTECHNLCHRIFSVFFCYIFDYAGSLRILEVHVDIRHGYTFRIQETFKQKIIANRIQLCNSKRISYQTACCRSSSRSYHNVMVSCIPDEIPHNKEIIHIPHIFNNTQLIIKTFFQVFCTFRITFL